MTSFLPAKNEKWWYILESMVNPGIEKIAHQGELLALIIKNDFSAPGIQFFTPNEFSQQLAYMQHPPGKVILPHVHNPVEREVKFTQEVLFIRKGKVRVDFYTSQKEYLFSRELVTGDIILLASGGHGFEVLEPLEMIEVKQGPYAGEHDKTRFQPIDKSKVQIR
jgi:mannose-6-phosphate isomerase-like protein (cupin superfamily)